MRRERLDRAIEEIREYTRLHSELRAAHHFVFDLPLDKSAGTPEIVVMGINPGEVESQWHAVPGPTEETWNFDFHETIARSRSSRNWYNNMRFFANGQPVISTELFFWSSKDQNEFEKRFGTIWESPHLRFCAAMNRVLIEEYQPTMVIFPGLGHAEGTARVFGLRHLRTVTREGTRLVEHYGDGKRPWFFTRHWSGAFGFSQAQKQAIKDYIHAQKQS